MTDTRPEDSIPDAEVVTDPVTQADARRDMADPLRDVASDLPPPPPPAPNRARRGRAVFLGLVLGGAVAAGLGFAAARYVPQGWPLAVPTTATDDAEALERRLATLESQLQTLAAREPAAPPPDPRIDGIAAELAELRAGLADAPAPDPALADRIGALDSRLAAIEQAPLSPGGGVSPAAFAALQAEVRALREGAATGASDAAQAVVAEVQAAADVALARLAEAEARAQALTEATEAATAATARTAALAQLRTAIDTGLPFDAALADLSTAGVAVPDDLTAAASAGVPSLADLQDSFPAAARAALAASRQADMGDTFGDRLGSFLQNQTGARSLEPREGTDPDAVLSRAEAALRGGDIATTLAELQGLPPEGQAALADWTAQAQGRIAVQEAAVALAAQAGN